MSIIYINPYTFAAATVGDPYFFSVATLLHLDGTNGSTTFTDTSPLPKTVTAVGSAQISTAEAQFDQSLLLNDANNYTNYLTTPDNASFQMGTGDFTIEAWIYLISKPKGVAAIISSGSSNYNANGGYFVVDSSNRIQFGIPGAAISGGTISTGQWYHVAGTRSGTTTRIFINGTLEATGTGDSNNYNFSKDNLLIGRDGWDGSGSQGFHGYIDDVRITKGVARYTATFSVPNAPFPNSYGAGAPDIITTNLTLNLDAGNALSYTGSGTTWTDLSGNGINGTLTNFSGSFYDAANGGSLLFDGNNDYVVGSCSQLQSGNNPFSVECWFRWAGDGVNASNLFFCYGVDNPGGGQLPLQYVNSATGKIEAQFGSSSGLVSSTTTIQTNTWYQFISTYDLSSHKIYINGSLEGTTNYNLVNIGLNGNNGQTFGLGCLFSSFGTVGPGEGATRRYGTYNGNISVVRFYKKALSGLECIQNFNAIRSRYGL